MLNLMKSTMVVAVLAALPLSAADFNMKVTGSGYLDTQGFTVILYESTYHPIFVDQKNTALEMILHGQRIATNGDVRLMPTPEQWDLVAQLKGRQPDRDKNRITANLSFPDFQMDYTVEVTAEPRGANTSSASGRRGAQRAAGIVERVHGEIIVRSRIQIVEFNLFLTADFVSDTACQEQCHTEPHSLPRRAASPNAPPHSVCRWHPGAPRIAAL